MRAVLLMLIVFALLTIVTANALAAATFVSGLAPDWNQPYRYGPPPGGPSDPAPGPGPAFQWNAWCAPASAANLAGHWADVRGVPVADTTPFPGSTVNWAAGPSWHDYEADGFARPQPQAAPGPLPTPATDIGWYMDTNLGIVYDPPGVGTMGGFFFGNPNHTGSYLKDIHVGLQNYLNTRYSLSGGILWKTGTRGVGYAAGIDPTGAPAVVHPNEPSAFAEVKSEIDTNRTLILCFRYWNPAKTIYGAPRTGTNTESALGYTNYVWGTTPSPPYTNAEDEVWNFYDNGMALGHAVTCVGYIPAGDAADRGPVLGLGPTDWVIVHDNWVSTTRNVAIPYGSGGMFNAAWVANTTAVPWPSECPPPPTNSPTKWIQSPDLTNGMNVLVVAPKILADDFLCTTNGPVTDIHIWGSWLFDQVGIITNFHISFHADIPAGVMPYSRPGAELWSADFAPGEFTYEVWTNAFELFFDPNTGETGYDTTVFRYDFVVDPCKAFVQTNGVIYWMDVQVYTVGGVFGWKSSGTHCYDDAVWADAPDLFWQELRYPPGHPLAGQSFDLAFELTTTPPTSFPTKWIQYPDLVNGMDVMDTVPKVLGDDFRCYLTGPITDIHIWGSWLNNAVGIITNMHISFYSDVPAGVDQPWSHPGNLLWTTNFWAGQYSFEFYTNATEMFYEPPAAIMGFDSQVFRYNFCIEPCRAFIQTNGVTYWLVAQADTIFGFFGWKSSGTHCYDDAVWSDSSVGMPWQELRYPSGHPLEGQSFDLAFELTTPIPFDVWQVQYFGSTTNVDAAAGADPDGDGMSNTNEYLAGTVPTNGMSSLRIVSIERQSSTNINLAWTTVGCHTYLVQTNLPVTIGGITGNFTNNWADLGPPITVLGSGESTNNQVHVGGATSNNPALYYRVRLLCQ